MSEFDFEQEVVAEAEVSTEVPVVKERQLYTLKDGITQGSRAEYIREIFLQDNLSRKEIAEQFDIPYRIVYSATVNLENEADAPTRGRAAQNAVIQVTEDNQLVIVDAEGTVFVQGEAIEGPAPETIDKARNEWIQEMVDADVARGDIAKMLGLSYGVIYGITKDADGVRAKHMVTLDDGTEMPRSEYIRKLFAEGKERGEIAKELDVAYTVVWQATKVAKSDADKFAEAIEHLAAFAEQVSDKEVFADVIASLKALTIVEVEEEVVAEA